MHINGFQSFSTTFTYHSTKSLIEEYMDEVVSQLEYIETTSNLDQQAKLKFFMDTRQSFGCSALILQGGATFGTSNTTLDAWN